MIIAGKDDIQKKPVRKRKRKNRPTIGKSPETTPWNYIPYGTKPNIILGYAVVRAHMRKPWFSHRDFHAFRDRKDNMRQLGDQTRQLVRIGYLEKREQPLRHVHDTVDGKLYKYMVQTEYRITPKGVLALHETAKMHRIRQEQNMRRNARRHGKSGANLRWGDDDED